MVPVVLLAFYLAETETQYHKQSSRLGKKDSQRRLLRTLAAKLASTLKLVANESARVD